LPIFIGRGAPFQNTLSAPNAAEFTPPRSLLFLAFSRPSNPHGVRVSSDGFRDVFLSPMAGSSDRSYCAVDTRQLE
jgi:hypothetical protein